MADSNRSTGPLRIALATRRLGNDNRGFPGVKRSAVYSALLALFMTTMPVVGARAAAAFAQPDPVGPHGVYTVLMAGEPVVTYDGGTAGLAATQPETGTRLDVRSGAVRKYQDHLRGRHETALVDAGAEPTAVLYDYTVAVNGFAATLSARQAAALSAQPGVLSVQRDRIRTVATDSSPDFLGLTDPRGPWATGYTGEDVVIGFIDTGIWPEHASFADTGSYGAAPANFIGTACEFGDAVAGALAYNGVDADFTCNGKVVAAAAFGAGLASGNPDGLAAGEFLSARDANGHGTHVAAIAAGNGDVTADIGGLSPATVTGIAPSARVAAYKACWSVGERHGQCAVSDIVAAVDQAVADGVDVLNLSVGSASGAVSADDLALLFAGAAGVMVTTAAGNLGPTTTVTAPGGAPWVTTVAAATQLREFGALATLGDGRVIEGISAGESIADLPLVDAGSIENPTCDPALGFAESIAGAVVLCPEARESLSAAETVAANGGAAVVLVSAGQLAFASPTGDVPAITVGASGGAALAAYAQAEKEAATISIGASAALTGTGTGSILAPFSSRGPSPLHDDLLKPDVVAPGVSILAATSPASLTGSAGDQFAVMNGTSMASAHVAGVFALLRQAHPAWTADMARSALITTTRRDVWMPDGSTAAGGLDMGAGYIQPGGAVNRRGSLFNPGLVFATATDDFLLLLCGLDGEPTCSEEAIAARDLNSPAIALAGLTGSATVTRTVTSVADKLRVFDARIDAPPGFAVEVTPRTISLSPGETASFEVTITKTRAPAAEWRHGTITWASDSYRIAMPVVVSALAAEATPAVTASGTAGRADISVSFGYSGDYNATATRLATPTVIQAAVTQDASHDIDAALRSGDGVTSHPLDLPAGTAHLRVAVEGAAPSTDLDLYVVGPDGNVLAAAASAGANEVIDIAAPREGAHRIVVHGWETGSAAADYRLSLWTVGEDGNDPLDIVGLPRSAERGSTGLVTVRWSSLEPNVTYLGVVSHTGDTGLLGRTVVTIGPDQSSRSQQPVQANRRPRRDVR